MRADSATTLRGSNATMRTPFTMDAAMLGRLHRSEAVRNWGLSHNRTRTSRFCLMHRQVEPMTSKRIGSAPCRRSLSCAFHPDGPRVSVGNVADLESLHLARRKAGDFYQQRSHLFSLLLKHPPRAPRRARSQGCSRVVPRRDTLASKHKCLTPINKTGTSRIATKVGTQKDRTREFRDRPTPPSLPSVAVPHPRERPVRPLPAGDALHARARA